jgi:hypothetical protein
LFTLPAIAALHSKKHLHRYCVGRAGRIQFLNLLPYKPLAFVLSDIRDGPYTPARAADLAIPRQGSGYPHIASPAAMFQFCSIGKRGNR